MSTNLPSPSNPYPKSSLDLPPSPSFSPSHPSFQTYSLVTTLVNSIPTIDPSAPSSSSSSFSSSSSSSSCTPYTPYSPEPAKTTTTTTTTTTTIPSTSFPSTLNPSEPSVPFLFQSLKDTTKAIHEGRPTYIPYQGLSRTFKLGTHAFAIFSPKNTSSFVITHLFVFGPMALYYYAIAFTWWPSAWIFVSIWLHVSCCFSFFKAAFTDPGILPRYTHVRIEDNRCVDNDPIDITVHGLPAELKYCYTCKIYRHPRAFHCTICDNCVANHDHHCPWIANCVGLGNYRYFLTLISNASILTLLVLVQCFLFSLATPLPFWDHLVTHPFVFLLFILLLFLAFSLWPLTGFHWYLIFQNRTTHEHVKYSGEASSLSSSPYTFHVCYNFIWTLCRPFLPSTLKRWTVKEPLLSNTSRTHVGQVV